MKTAISIPDPIFQKAEETAKKLGLSRSELYTKAISKFVDDHKNKDITQVLNETYSTENSHLTPSLQTLQTQSLDNDEW